MGIRGNQWTTIEGHYTDDFIKDNEHYVVVEVQEELDNDKFIFENFGLAINHKNIEDDDYIMHLAVEEFKKRYPENKKSS